MNQLKTEILILEDGQTPPSETATPPRQPKWNDTLNYIANPNQFCQQNLAQYGPIFKTSVFGGTTVMLGSPNAISMAFNGDLNYTEIALPATTMEMFGEYSLFQRPDLHRQRKTALAPGMTGMTLAGYIPYINDTVRSRLQNWSTSGSIALYPAVEKICFDILTYLLLGVRLDDHEPATFAGLPISSKAELKALYKTYFDGFYGLLKWNSPFTAYGRGIKARATLINFMRAVVKRRRDSGEVINPTGDFLSMMLASQTQNPDSVFSDTLIQNQCLLELWASHYQISGLISSLIYQLGNYPQVIERLREEQTEVLGIENNNFTISFSQLKQTVFLEATIKETLRTLPPSSTANRRLTKSVVVDNILYEKGWVLIAEPRLAHIIPEHFPQPEIFDPNRFLPERGEGKMYQFIPFGGGVHACLGAQLAMAVTKVFASHVLHLFDWQLIGEPKFVEFPLKKIKDDYQILLMAKV